MNNSIANEIYLKIRHNASLWTDCMIWHLLVFRITTHYFDLGFWILVRMAFWKRFLPISIGRNPNIFKIKLWKKAHLELQTFQQLCSMTSTYLGKKCTYVLELLFLKLIENGAFLFKSTCKNELGTFLFEGDIFLLCGLVVALIFLISAWIKYIASN